MPTADASLWNMAGLNEKIGRLLQARVYYSDFKNWRECFFFTIVWYLIIGRWCSLWAEIKNSPSGGSSTNQDNKGEFWAGDLWKSITGSRGEVMNTSSQAYIIQASLRLKPVLSSSPSTCSNTTNNSQQLCHRHHHCHWKAGPTFLVQNCLSAGAFICLSTPQWTASQPWQNITLYLHILDLEKLAHAKQKSFVSF